MHPSLPDEDMLTDDTADSMNYTIVLNGFVWVASMTYYVLFARKWYTGPKMTVNTSESRPALERKD